MRTIRTAVALAALMITAPAMADGPPLTCLQAVRVLAEIAKTDYDRSDEIDREGAKVPLMTIMLYAHNTETLCTAELGAR